MLLIDLILDINNGRVRSKVRVRVIPANTPAHVPLLGTHAQAALFTPQLLAAQAPHALNMWQPSAVQRCHSLGRKSIESRTIGLLRLANSEGSDGLTACSSAQASELP